MVAMLESKLVSTFSCIYRREHNDKCDKLLIGMNRILGLFNVRRTEFFFKITFFGEFAHVPEKSNQDDHYVEEEARQQICQTEPIDILTRLTMNVVFSHSPESAF